MNLSLEQFQELINIWIFTGIAIFIALQFIAAPYGRYIDLNEKGSKWGPTINNRSGWILMELPALIICPTLIITGSNTHNPYILFFLTLWLLHYVHRTLIFPFKLQSNGRRIPITTILFGVIFNVINGFICGYYLGVLEAPYSVDYWLQINFLIGLIIFILGMALNIRSDYHLINLRINNPGQRYQIPQGGGFEYVSSPNLVGEIVQWSGFAIMVWALPVATFAMWTIFNLVPRTFRNHNWYKQQFADYPAKRKALIPYIL